MSDASPNNDDILLDRLVDGELSADERRRLLASLEDRPDGWRRCALAFLEAQAWREQLGRVVSESPATEKPTPAPADRPTRRRYLVSFPALAASLLVAFGLGVAVRQSVLSPRLPGPNPRAQIAANDTRDTRSAASAEPVKPDSDVVTLWVRDQATGRAQPVRVPLVDARTLDSQLGLEFQPALPAYVRDELRAEGYDVQSKRRYAPLRIDGGRSMVVPVEDTRIVPVSQPVY
jgi:anti-sigma factor RsiW